MSFFILIMRHQSRENIFNADSGSNTIKLAFSKCLRLLVTTIGIMLVLAISHIIASSKSLILVLRQASTSPLRKGNISNESTIAFKLARISCSVR